jgi:succinate dehydrogenase / fumarate reductase cytochrome b subunit
MDNKKPLSRPVYINLLKIRQPVTALASIGHRISGVLLFLSIPLMIWMLDQSLRGPEEYQQIIALYEQPLMKLVVLLLAWAGAHHFFAGIRFLLIDVDWGVDLATARRTALIVNICGVAGVLIALMVLL